MFVLDNIKLSTRNFKTRKLRTFLTILGISVGIAAILFLVSLGYGMQRMLLERIAKSDALLALDVSTTNSSVLQITQDTVAEFKRLPNVVEVSPQQVVLSQLEIEGISSNVTMNAVDEAYFRLSGLELMKGEIFKDEKDPHIILSTGAIKSLGYEDPQQAFGKDVKITLIIPADENADKNDLITENKEITLDDTFMVTGIIDDEFSSSGYFSRGWMDKTGLTTYDGAKVKVEDQKFIETAREAIIEKGYAVSALSDTIDQANKIFSVMQIILAMFGIVALVVSAIGMFNTMTIALLERTNEIGIMKSIGASNREILFLFLTESILIGFLGGLGGIIIGLGGAEGVNYGFNILAKSMGGQSINIFYTPTWFLMFVMTFSTLIGLVTGVYPARRAAKLNPLMALRYK